jgi:hypothetical protein
MHLVLRWWVLGFFLFWSGRSLAAPSETDDESGPKAEKAAEVRSPPSEEKRYLDYRLHLVGADTLAAGLLVSAALLEDGAADKVAFSGLAVYVLGGPTVHLAHGQWKRSLASLGMRVGFPLAGALPGLALYAGCDRSPPDPNFTDETNDVCPIVGAGLAALGAIAGGLTALIIDDSSLGKVPLDDASTAAPATGGSNRAESGAFSAALVPMLDQRRKTLGLSLIGAF